MNAMKVYLAGGTHSNWQDAVIDSMDAKYFDPRDVQILKDLALIARFERMGVEEANVVFAYLEADNPSGMGLAAELAYGRAMGARVIFVDEQQSRYSKWLAGFLEGDGTVVVDNLVAGVEALKAEAVRRAKRKWVSE